MGPQIRVDVLPPSIVQKWAKNQNINVPTAPNQAALLDTGASVTGIDEDLLKKLNYPPIGTANLSSPSGSSQTLVYVVMLVIPSRSAHNFPTNIPRIRIDNVRAVSVKLTNKPYKILLGRDIISKMVMIYNGPQAVITLGY